MSLPRVLRPLRRLARRILPTPTGPFRRLEVVHHTEYRLGIPGIPMDPLRGERILTALLEEGWIGRRAIQRPREAPVEHLRRVHTGPYLRSLDDPLEVSRIMGVQLTPEEATAALELQRRMVGGTILATHMALRSRESVIHLGGGLHHAAPDRGTGFCLLNDVAVAIQRLRVREFTAPILVVDLDLHDGNGTRIAFAGDPGVHTYSLHNETWDEVPGAQADTCLAFGPGVDDEGYLDLLRETLPPVVQGHRPELVLYLAGADVSAEDTLGDAALTLEGMGARDRFVVETVQAVCGRIPFVTLLAGGYGAGAWKSMARFAPWMLSGRMTDPPDDLTVALERVRRQEPRPRPFRDRRLRLRRPGFTEDPAVGKDMTGWSLEPEDLAALGAGPTASPLLLGRYSRRDLEEGLERFGILGQARARGYREPTVEILPSSGFGPTIRLFGEPERTFLLMELRLDLDRTSIPDAELLKVEWLLLQDPRASFHPGYRPLPGQAHPGLGSLVDVVAWLVTLCRDAELDGLSFRSSHWHMAALARRRLRFPDPDDGRRFRVIQEATRGMSLSAATRAVDEARVVDRRTGRPVPWAEVLMVVPVAADLDERLAALGDEAEDQEGDPAAQSPSAAVVLPRREG